MKPILFNTDMVRAILDGRKTVTRRIVKPQPPENARLEIVGDRRHAMDLSIEIPGPDDHRIYTPPYLPGDVLYVRETFMKKETSDRKSTYLYKANPAFENVTFGSPWHPSIHMPKEAARIFLRVNDVRVEPMQEITDKEARSEGCGDTDVVYYNGWLRCEFAKLWDSTVAPKKLLHTAGLQIPGYG